MNMASREMLAHVLNLIADDAGIPTVATWRTMSMDGKVNISPVSCPILAMRSAPSVKLDIKR